MGGKRKCIMAREHINVNREMKTKMSVNYYFNILIPRDTYGRHDYINIHLNKQLYSLDDAIRRRDEVIGCLQPSALPLADSVGR